MLKNKKTIIIISSIIMLVIILIIVGVLLINKDKEKTKNNTVTEEQLKTNFTNMFSNIEYSEDEEAIVSLLYDFQKSEQGKCNINVHLPKIDIDTQIVNDINEDILNIFGTKLIDIVKNNTTNTIYNVDYVTFTNNNILSLVIKCTLKEGNNPQRSIIKTYNYDIYNDKIVNLEELLELKTIDKNSLQSQIINEVREKNENASTLAEQGYNIYVRDIRSDEYLINNITTYYLGQDGNLYIVFAYGNNHFTETMDIIIV